MSHQPELSPEVLQDITWRTSSRTQSVGGQCVEVGQVPDGSHRVAVRHSHYPKGSIIVYTQDEWKAFLDGAMKGEFDFNYSDEAS